jgi:hypothetical protein
MTWLNGVLRNNFPSTRIGVASNAAFLLSGISGWSALVRCVQATWSCATFDRLICASGE